jgi:hypothetical protein
MSLRVMVLPSTILFASTDYAVGWIVARDVYSDALAQLNLSREESLRQLLAHYRDVPIAFVDRCVAVARGEIE